MEIPPEAVTLFVAGLSDVVRWIINRASGHGNHDQATIEALAKQLAQEAIEKINWDIVASNLEIATDALADAAAKCLAEMKRLDALMPPLNPEPQAELLPDPLPFDTSESKE